MTQESTTPTDTVRLSIEDGIAEVALNRPEKHNAVDLSVLDGLVHAGQEIMATEGVRAVILRGEGPNFCSGIDTSLFTANPDPKALIAQILTPSAGEIANKFQKPCTIWREVQAPVIAAIDGVCYGAGLQIALGADIRIAAPEARLSIMEIKWGLIPDMGLTTTLPRIMSADRAKELIFTGRVVGAPEAEALGLITRQSATPLDEARALAQTIAGKNPDAIQRAKTLVDATWTMEPGDALHTEAELQSQIIGQPNQLEAVFAQMQNRPPQFR